MGYKSLSAHFNFETLEVVHKYHGFTFNGNTAVMKSLDQRGSNSFSQYFESGSIEIQHHTHNTYIWNKGIFLKKNNASSHS